jgi:hypothetical protein
MLHICKLSLQPKLQVQTITQNIFLSCTTVLILQYFQFPSIRLILFIGFTPSFFLAVFFIEETRCFLYWWNIFKYSLYQLQDTNCIRKFCFIFGKYGCRKVKNNAFTNNINTLNTELNPICHLLALLGAHHILHVSGIRVKPLKQARTFL